ncbi:hypothetical protein F9C07_2966 [Aspergillus flavus]|uniref:Uncharacterized protein n=2 Tax=Aspergillus flavus TaxID=5059 RepID=A0A7U2MED9_ASPFN|nr:hypothetical protein NYO67_3152 [Aspergillus flavus]QRD82116.1 hypothetical protein F9C07_2966 [Aspergillus flavus]RAQ48166.1 hypothetical protein AFGD_004343 [Aspergillus flavus]RMZ46210.1 hypothetical protein CA14_011709 [Aspergillus flavus]UDD55624.1 hypothetical protein AFCA_003225 [Aspergillus flavus]
MPNPPNTRTGQLPLTKNLRGKEGDVTISTRRVLVPQKGTPSLPPPHTECYVAEEESVIISKRTPCVPNFGNPTASSSPRVARTVIMIETSTHCERSQKLPGAQDE